MKLRQVVGKFVVLDGAKEPQTVEQAGTGPAAAGGEPPEGFDVRSIYRQAGIKELAFGAEQVLEVLASLEILNSVPSERGLELKRKAVNELVLTKSAAVGATPAVVLDDARRKVESLNAAAKQAASESTDFIAACEKELARLADEIQKQRTAIEQIRAQEQQVKLLCRAEAERLQTVLDILDDEP